MPVTDFISYLGFSVGPLTIGPTVITSWFLLVLIGGFAWLATRTFTINNPGRLQTSLEGFVMVMESTIASVIPEQSRLLLPFIGSLWIYLVVANLLGLIPGLGSPTTDLAQTSALAVLVFLSVHFYGLLTNGWKYFRHYLVPNPVFLPFHILGELTRTLALALRLFGNMMSLELAAVLILMVAGFLAPIPLLVLHVIEALVQAYIFGMLALIYLAGGIQSQQAKDH